jgi:NUMOD3 motif-containing protein
MFYTYLWLRENGTPYYVGKGSGNRAFVNKNHYVSRPSKDYIIVQEFLSEDDSLQAERFLISYYGRIDLNTGCLRNLTDGGDGVTGHRHTEESKKRIGESAIGRAGVGQYWRGRKRSAETIRRMSDAAKVREARKTPEQRSEEARIRQSAGFTEETRRKQSLAKLGTKQSEETIRRRSESMKATLARKRNSPQGQE